MKLEYGSKSLEYDGSGAVSATKVTLVNSDGANVPIFLAPDKINLSNTELLELALEVIYQENFPQRAENEKFSELEKLTKTNRDKTEANQTEVEKLNSLTEVLVLVAIETEGGMAKKLYEKVATLLPALENGKRYTFGDLVRAEYPYTTNPKYPQGSPIILKFLADWNHKGQPLQEMLSKGACATVMPNLG